MINFLNSNPSVLATISIILILFGWNVIYKNSRKITDRSETHILMQAFFNRIEMINEVGAEYWIKIHHTPEEASIKSHRFEALISQLKLDIKLLSKRNIHLNASLDIVRIRKALTLDAQHPEKILASLKQIKVDDLNIYGSNLREKAYNVFMIKYPLT
tara:strand:+ start:14 stop:487 length:474 start_codon:yes stop_codon:yes gene_type:complete